MDRSYNKYNNNEKYVGAPYNFVPISSKVIEYSKTDLPKHNDVSEELIEGEIQYTVSSLTPVFIGSGIRDENDVEQFYKDQYARYAIPGSSMRGLIKTNTQILSLSSITDDIDDYSLMFRAVASGPKKEKERYAEILGAKQITIQNGTENQTFSVLKKVKAGYIKNEKGNYIVYGTAMDSLDDDHGEMNYYILSERAVIEGYNKAKKTNKMGDAFIYSFFIRNNNILMSELNTTYIEETDRNGRKHYKANSNKTYKPYACPCSYKVEGNKVISVKKRNELSKEGFKNGFAVSTGVFKGPKNEKKAIYIIPEVSFNKVVKKFDKNDDDLKAFRIDLKKRNTSLRNFGGVDWFDLPKEGQLKPVFYIEDGKHFYFGFTPRLRLFYDHTIADGIPSAHKTAKLDYAKALFGYSSKEASYKSRVFFTDAVVNDPAKEAGREDYIQGEPKPTSYLDYVTTDDRGTGKSFNDDGFELSGIKQYWIHKNPVKSNVPEGKENAKYVTHFIPLARGTKFIGKIRFRNMRKDELGLLLWALKPEDDSIMNIGKAKSFGYGCIDISIDYIKILDKNKAYNTEILSLDPFEYGYKKEDFINLFRECIKKENAEKTATIKTFLAMKKYIPDESNIRYMSLNNREYQNRTKPLPKALDIINNNKGGRK